MTTVGFSDMAAITGRTLDQLKGFGRFTPPLWDDSDFEAGKRRRYDASHALAVVLVEVLTARGEPMASAVRTVSDQRGVIEAFFSDMSVPRFVMTMATVIKRPGGPRSFEEQAFAWYGTPDEVADQIKGALAQAVRYHHTGHGAAVSAIYAQIASVGDAYDLLRERARVAGYRIEGRNILQIMETDE
jgi:hypothetical protein